MVITTYPNADLSVINTIITPVNMYVHTQQGNGYNIVHMVSKVVGDVYLPTSTGIGVYCQEVVN